MLKTYSYNFNALGSANKISLVADSDLSAENIFQKALAEVARIEAKYSRYQADSILSAINRQARKGRVEVDSETAQLLNYAAACFSQSKGLFDITSGVLRSIWNFKEPRIPSPSERELQSAGNM